MDTCEGLNSTKEGVWDGCYLKGFKRMLQPYFMPPCLKASSKWGEPMLPSLGVNWNIVLLGSLSV